MPRRGMLKTLKDCTSVHYRTKKLCPRTQESLSLPRFLSKTLYFGSGLCRNMEFKFILLSKFSKFRNPHAEKLMSMHSCISDNSGAFVKHKGNITPPQTCFGTPTDKVPPKLSFHKYVIQHGWKTNNTLVATLENQYLHIIAFLF